MNKPQWVKHENGKLIAPDGAARLFWEIDEKTWACWKADMVNAPADARGMRYWSVYIPPEVMAEIVPEASRPKFRVSESVRADYIRRVTKVLQAVGNTAMTPSLREHPSFMDVPLVLDPGLVGDAVLADGVGPLTVKSFNDFRARRGVYAGLPS